MHIIYKKEYKNDITLRGMLQLLTDHPQTTLRGASVTFFLKEYRLFLLEMKSSIHKW